MNDIVRSFKPNGGKSVKIGLLNMWTTKCMTLMELLLQELNEKKWGGTHSLTSSQQFLLCEPLPQPFLGHIITMRS
jgi:hypothetical protein